MLHPFISSYGSCKLDWEAEVLEVLRRIEESAVSGYIWWRASAKAKALLGFFNDFFGLFGYFLNLF